MNACPKCGKPLYTWYQLSTEQAVCACSNLDCPLFDLNTYGDHTGEAIDRFHGEALRREAREERRK